MPALASYFLRIEQACADSPKKEREQVEERTREDGESRAPAHNKVTWDARNK